MRCSSSRRTRAVVRPPCHVFVARSAGGRGVLLTLPAGWSKMISPFIGEQTRHVLEFVEPGNPVVRNVGLAFGCAFSGKEAHVVSGDIYRTSSSKRNVLAAKRVHASTFFSTNAHFCLTDMSRSRHAVSACGRSVRGRYPPDRLKRLRPSSANRCTRSR